MPLPTSPDLRGTPQAATPSSHISVSIESSPTVNQLGQLSHENRKLELKVRVLQIELNLRNSEFKSLQRDFEKEEARVQDVQSRLLQLKNSCDESLQLEGRLLDECHQATTDLKLAIIGKRRLEDMNVKHLEEIAQLQQQNTELQEGKDQIKREYDLDRKKYEKNLRDLKSKVQKPSASFDRFIPTLPNGPPLTSTQISIPIEAASQIRRDRTDQWSCSNPTPIHKKRRVTPRYEARALTRSGFSASVPDLNSPISPYPVSSSGCSIRGDPVSPVRRSNSNDESEYDRSMIAESTPWTSTLLSEEDIGFVPTPPPNLINNGLEDEGFNINTPAQTTGIGLQFSPPEPISPSGSIFYATPATSHEDEDQDEGNWLSAEENVDNVSGTESLEDRYLNEPISLSLSMVNHDSSWARPRLPIVGSSGFVFIIVNSVSFNVPPRHFVAQLKGERLDLGRCKYYIVDFFMKNRGREVITFTRNAIEQGYEIVDENIVTHLPEPITDSRGRHTFQFDFSQYRLGDNAALCLDGNFFN